MQNTTHHFTFLCSRQRTPLTPPHTVILFLVCMTPCTIPVFPANCALFQTKTASVKAPSSSPKHGRDASRRCESCAEWNMWIRWSAVEQLKHVKFVLLFYDGYNHSSNCLELELIWSLRPNPSLGRSEASKRSPNSIMNWSKENCLRKWLMLVLRLPWQNWVLILHLSHLFWYMSTWEWMDYSTVFQIVKRSSYSHSRVQAHCDLICKV